VSLRRDQLITVNKAVNEKVRLETGMGEEEEKNRICLGCWRSGMIQDNQLNTIFSSMNHDPKNQTVSQNYFYHRKKLSLADHLSWMCSTVVHSAF
jgi:hypothetical protein